MSEIPKKLRSDDRPAQALRVADYLERKPDSTAKEIDSVCDTGCITKVLSEMPALGYGLARGWCYVPCADGTHRRQVRTYRLLYRPKAQPDLFTPA